MPGILFDARWLRPGMTGVGYYALRLLQSLRGSGERIGIILMRGSPYAASFPEFRVHEAPVDLTAHPRTEIFEQAGIPLLCMRHGYRSFVSLEGRVPAFHPGIRTFSFIYDLSILKVPGSHSRKYSFFLLLGLRISRLTATRIVTISDAVRDDLARLGKVPPGKVMVVHPGDTGLDALEPIPVEGLAEGFLLTVGVTNPRKNLDRLLAAYALLDRATRPPLALTGNPRLIAEGLRKAGIDGAANLGFVEEGKLRWLYSNARALVFPTLDEGFGLPLLDALKAGCPVVCSDIPVFREVLGGGPHYFDPESPDSIAKGMEACGAKPDPAWARSILERFSWENASRAFLAGLRKAGG